MAISKAGTISVIIAVGFLYFTSLHPGWIFLISGIGVTLIYRAIKGCFNFINPMGIAGAGAVVVSHYIFPNPIIALLSGLVISVVVGLVMP